MVGLMKFVPGFAIIAILVVSMLISYAIGNGSGYNKGYDDGYYEGETAGIEMVFNTNEETRKNYNKLLKNYKELHSNYEQLYKTAETLAEYSGRQQAVQSYPTFTSMSCTSIDGSWSTKTYCHTY